MSYTLSLLVFVINRTRAVRQHVSTATKYKKIDGRTGRVKIVITIIWFISIILTAPILVGIIESWPFPARYSCHLAHEWTPWYGIVSSSFPYATVWFGYLICSLLVYSAFKVERKREEIDKRGQVSIANKLATNTAIFMAQNQMWLEMKNILLMVALLVIYALFLGPYIVFTKTNHIYQYWDPYDLELYRNLSNTYYEDESHEESITNTARLARSHQDIEDNTNLTLHNSYWEVPEIKEGNSDAETVFVWLRFIHFALVPIVVFILNKDVRQKAGDLLICCGRSRSNSITPRPISAMLHRQHLELHRKQEQKKFKLCDYHVPVLFATQEGLYLRVLDNEVAAPPSKDHHEPVNKDNLWTIEPQFFTDLCDLKIETQTFVTHLDEERKTSEDNTTVENHSDPEDHHHHHHNHHGKEKKKVQFRNTVVDIDDKLAADVGGAVDHVEYKDVHQRKMTGLGDRRLSAASHKKHRRPSFNPDVKSRETDKRRNSD